VYRVETSWFIQTRLYIHVHTNKHTHTHNLPVILPNTYIYLIYLPSLRIYHPTSFSMLSCTYTATRESTCLLCSHNFQ